MRLHLVSLPHTQTTNASQVCAFTQKAVKFCKMMTDLGYEVILYAGEENEAACTEHVVCVTQDQQRRWYGDFDPNTLPTIATFNPDHVPWLVMNERVIEEMRKRIEPEDIICLTMGRCQMQIAAAFPEHQHVEWAVGYEGIFSGFCCFESYAWMHNRYGANNIVDGRFYDTVIPNFFFTEQFSYCETPSDYLLFVGRITARKGVHVASEIAKRAGRQLLIAGPGVTESSPGRIASHEYVIEGDHINYIGILDPLTREEIMKNAAAIIVPTLYIEPFGAVAVEAMLSGTPAITTDWGAFPETNVHGTTGYRFRTLAEGVQAVEDLDKLDRLALRKFTQDRYSIETIGPQYDRWFQNVHGLWQDGWYA